MKRKDRKFQTFFFGRRIDKAIFLLYRGGKSFGNEQPACVMIKMAWRLYAYILLEWTFFPPERTTRTIDSSFSECYAIFRDRSGG